MNLENARAARARTQTWGTSADHDKGLPGIILVVCQSCEPVYGSGDCDPGLSYSQGCQASYRSRPSVWVERNKAGSLMSLSFLGALKLSAAAGRAAAVK